MSSLMKIRSAKILLLGLWFLFIAVMVGNQVVKSDRLTADEYNAKIAKTYDFRFGENQPFAPSNSTTYNGKFIAGSDFISSERCAACHTDVHPQWRQSAHANAFREPFYQKNVKDLITQKDIAYTRHCESCHNPAALFSGALTDKPQFKNRPFDDEGVSCIACHSIESVNGRGVGGYVMGQPALLQKEDGTKILDASNQDVLNNVEDHKRAMMRDVLKKPEFCAACHKSQVPKELNDYKFLRAFAVGDELQTSSFSKESPQPFYVRDKATCNTCHMPAEKAKFFDVSAKNGVVASHRWAAANTAIPAVYGYKEQLDAVEKFLQDDKLGVDIFAMRLQKNGSSKEEFIAPVNHSNFKVDNGDTITADVVVTNKNIGHSFPPELRDFYEAYLEFTVIDSGGKTIYKSGYIKPDGYLDEFAHNYKTYLVKPDGSANEYHYIWQTRVIPQNLAIPSGRSDVARYRFVVPNNLTRQFKITAKLKYRRFTRIFSDYALGKATDLPIVTMATTEKVFNIGENTAETQTNPKAMPDWKRWNNYGIALLDQRQFPASADAFAKVIDSDEKYRPFALTNRALALMELDEWKEARKLIDRALELDPNNFRAVFQRARIERVEGNLDAAEADFRRVNQAYPRERLTLHQLGGLAKIKRDFTAAKNYYDQVLAIDPEDTGAHYNLMLIYSKLGMKQEAQRESKIFADLKDDPRTTALAAEFLQNNPAVGKRSLPYYVNDLKPFQLIWERVDYLSLFK